MICEDPLQKQVDYFNQTPGYLVADRHEQAVVMNGIRGWLTGSRSGFLTTIVL